MTQGNQKCVSSFLERFSDVLEPFKIFGDSPDEPSMLKIFISKLRPSNQRSLNQKVGLRVDYIETAFEIFEVFEEFTGLRSRGRVNTSFGNQKCKDNCNRKKKRTTFKNGNQSYPRESDQKNSESNKPFYKKKYSQNFKSLSCFICKSEYHLVGNCSYYTFIPGGILCVIPVSTVT